MSETDYTVHVTDSLWDALAAPFAATEVQWRVVKLSEDGSSAQVRPQLPLSAATARLDAVLGIGGWSHSFGPLGERGLTCTLSVGDVFKSAVAAYSGIKNPGVQDSGAQSLSEAAEDAFVTAAGLFGLQPTVLLAELPWVEYDAEVGQILYEPDLSAPDGDDTVGSLGESGAPHAVPLAETPLVEAAPAKSAGQQAIDKLVDRLKGEGRGLEAAKLLNAYGGYGSDPQTARELYAKLRELVLGAP